MAACISPQTGSNHSILPLVACLLRKSPEPACHGESVEPLPAADGSRVGPIVVFESDNSSPAGPAGKALRDRFARRLGRRARQIARLGDGFLVWEARRDGHWSIWTIKLDGSGLKQLTPVEDDRDQLCPHISPDGTTVAYLSLPRADGPQTGAMRKSPLRLIHADGTGERVIVADAHKYGGGWDRAVTWFTPTRAAYIGPDDNAYELDLANGRSSLLVSGGGGWLPNTALTHVVTSFNTFSLLDGKTKTVTPMPHLGGCQPYFTHDGQWGFWMANMGGPIGKMRLSTREWSILLDPAVLPKQRDYCYFPNVSSSQCLLAFAAANHEKLRGGYGGYDLSDYNVFVVQIDPNTLDVLGKPVRYSFDSVCNRFPDVYQPPLALGFRSNKAPFGVEYTSPGGGAWDWDFGDGRATRGPVARHVYAEPGLYMVSASQVRWLTTQNRPCHRSCCAGGEFSPGSGWAARRWRISTSSSRRFSTFRRLKPEVSWPRARSYQ